MVAAVVGQSWDPKSPSLQFPEELTDDPVPGTLISSESDLGLSEDLTYHCNSKEFAVARFLGRLLTRRVRTPSGGPQPWE